MTCFSTVFFCRPADRQHVLVKVTKSAGGFSIRDAIYSTNDSTFRDPDNLNVYDASEWAAMIS